MKKQPRNLSPKGWGEEEIEGDPGEGAPDDDSPKRKRKQRE